MRMMGELTFFLDLQVKQCKYGIFINQTKYIKDMLKKFRMEEVREIGTPMIPITKLDKDEKGKDVNQKLYRGMIGSLFYLTTSRLDVMSSVCLCARFYACHKESHLIVVKRIFKYLIGTQNLGLWYPKKSSLILLSFLLLIMLVVKLIGKTLVVHANFLVICLCLGVVKSKILLVV